MSRILVLKVAVLGRLCLVYVSRSPAGSNVDDDDDNAELSDEEAADGDAAEIKLRQRREQVWQT